MVIYFKCFIPLHSHFLTLRQIAFFFPSWIYAGTLWVLIILSWGVCVSVIRSHCVGLSAVKWTKWRRCLIRRWSLCWPVLSAVTHHVMRSHTCTDINHPWCLYIHSYCQLYVFTVAFNCVFSLFASFVLYMIMINYSWEFTAVYLSQNYSNNLDPAYFLLLIALRFLESWWHFFLFATWMRHWQQPKAATPGKCHKM